MTPPPLSICRRQPSFQHGVEREPRRPLYEDTLLYEGTRTTQPSVGPAARFAPRRHDRI